VLTQGDITSEGRFDDLVAYGGWSMDDHHPAGFRAARLGASATIYHPAPSPYGIPYRSLYSNTVRNLMFAGRCFSATHAALSSARVMGTCASMGQAVGTAAALAAARGLGPAGVLDCVKELQQQLLADDCYLPWVPQQMSELTRGARLATSRGNPEPVRDGVGRPVGDDMHAWTWRPGDWIAHAFDRPAQVKEVALALDSALDRDIALSLYGGHKSHACDRVPEVMPKRFRVECLVDGKWEVAHHINDNYQRFVRLPIDRRLSEVRLTLEELWGTAESRVYAFYVE
jgi:hypothetical protein